MRLAFALEQYAKAPTLGEKQLDKCMMAINRKLRGSVNGSMEESTLIRTATARLLAELKQCVGLQKTQEADRLLYFHSLPLTSVIADLQRLARMFLLWLHWRVSGAVDAHQEGCIEAAGALGFWLDMFI